MSDSTPRTTQRLSLEQLRKQAKELLRQYRAGEATARQRVAGAGPENRKSRPVTLAQAQFVLAREAGFDSWASLKHHVDNSPRSGMDHIQSFAEDLALLFETRDPAALHRIHAALGRTPTEEQLRAHVMNRLGQPGDSLTPADARLFVARTYGFGAWAELESTAAQSRPPRTLPPHGISTAPPFYRIRPRDGALEPRLLLSRNGWDEILDVMRSNGITALRASGQMNDSVLERVARLGTVTALDLSGCAGVTDEGLAHLARMPWIETLNLSGCPVTDQGLTVLRHLPNLREFQLHHHRGVSDAGLSHLAHCPQLERVNLMGSPAGDGAIRALAGKPRLRHFFSGVNVTDAGLALLHEFPVYKRWQGGATGISLMTFAPEPNHLLLRGQISDRGIESLAGLDGLFSLNLDDSRLAITARSMQPLAGLPHLSFLGVSTTDETMHAIAALPHLRMLMCQDTPAGDDGFVALSRSSTIEYIWGRRCHNLGGRGFEALARMPALRGLSVSCRNVGDGALARLPDFAALAEFMPMDVPDEGFRHLARCPQLEAVWCMYCRDTGDAATEHLAALPRLRTYYAGQTRITDRSLEILSAMESLERITLSSCAGVTNKGVAMLAALPRLRELTLKSMPRLTLPVVAAVPARVRLDFEL